MKGSLGWRKDKLAAPGASFTSPCTCSKKRRKSYFCSIFRVWKKSLKNVHMWLICSRVKEGGCSLRDEMHKTQLTLFYVVLGVLSHKLPNFVVFMTCTISHNDN